LKLSSKTDVDLKREDLFCVLINNITYQDFITNRERITEIVRSYQSWDPELFPLTNVLNPGFDFKVKILEVLSWISKQDIERAINRKVNEWGKDRFGAAINLKTLESCEVKKLFWGYLGKNKFLKLYGVLEGFIVNNREYEKLDIICGLELSEVGKIFSPVATKHKQLEVEVFRNMLRRQQTPVFLEGCEQERQKIAEETMYAVESSVPLISGWEGCLTSSLWMGSPFSVGLPLNLVVYTFISPVIELAKGKVTAVNLKTLEGYAKNSSTLKNVISFIDSYVISVNELLLLISDENLDHQQKTILTTVRNAIADAQEEMLEDEIHEADVT